MMSKTSGHCPPFPQSASATPPAHRTEHRRPHAALQAGSRGLLRTDRPEQRGRPARNTTPEQTQRQPHACGSQPSSPPQSLETARQDQGLCRNLWPRPRRFPQQALSHPKATQAPPLPEASRQPPSGYCAPSGLPHCTDSSVRSCLWHAKIHFGSWGQRVDRQKSFAQGASFAIGGNRP